MATPLETYESLKKEFNIVPEIELDDEFKKTFVQSQVEEIKKVLWRECVDFMISSKLAEDKDEIVANAGQSKKTEKKTNIKQFVRALNAYSELISELEKK